MRRHPRQGAQQQRRMRRHLPAPAHWLQQGQQHPQVVPRDAVRAGHLRPSGSDDVYDTVHLLSCRPVYTGPVSLPDTSASRCCEVSIVDPFAHRGRAAIDLSTSAQGSTTSKQRIQTKVSDPNARSMRCAGVVSTCSTAAIWVCSARSSVEHANQSMSSPLTPALHNNTRVCRVEATALGRRPIVPTPSCRHFLPKLQ